MKFSLKKVLCLVLTMCILCSTFALPVFADAESSNSVVIAEGLTAEKLCSLRQSHTINPGNDITYTIKLVNSTNADASVTVTDVIPSVATLKSGCDDVDGNLMTWNEVVPANESLEIAYTLTVKSSAALGSVLDGSNAKVNETAVGCYNIYVENTFNDVDNKKIISSIDTLNQALVTDTELAKVIYNNATSFNFTMAETSNKVLEQIFVTGVNAGAGSGSSGGVEEMPAVAANYMEMIVPTLYGGTKVDITADKYFRGDPNPNPTKEDLMIGDLVFLGSTSAANVYIYNGDQLVKLVSGDFKEVTREDANEVLERAVASEMYIVLRPSFVLTIYHHSTPEVDENLSDAQKAVIYTALAYQRRGYRVQYDDTTMNINQYRWQHSLHSPESYTTDNVQYTNCAAFCNDVYKNSIGYKEDVFTTGILAWAKDTVWRFTVDTSKTYSAAEKAAQEKAFYENLQPGDIINIRYSRSSGGGHAMLYVGNGTIIHSSGSNMAYGSEDVIETSIKVMRVADLWTEGNGRYVFSKLNSINIVRPLKSWSGEIPQNTINRITTMRGIVGEKLSSKNEYQTVNPGDEITYTFNVFNTNDETKTIEILDKVPANTTFVSGDLANDNGNLSYSLTLGANETKQVSYTIKVNENTPLGTKIESNEATIGGVIHPTHIVAVKNTLTDAQQTQITTSYNNNKANLKGVALANAIYKDVLGVETVLPHDTIDDILNIASKVVKVGDVINGTTVTSLSDKYIGNNYYFLLDSYYGKMIPERLLGGRYVYSPNGLYGDDYVRYPRQAHIIPGDIIIAKGGTGSGLYLYTKEGLVNLDKATINTDVDLACKKLLGNNCFIVLRPSITDSYEYTKTPVEIFIDELKALNKLTIKDEETVVKFETKVAEFEAYLTANPDAKLTSVQQTVYDISKLKIKDYRNPKVVAPEEHVIADGKIWFALGGNSKFFVKSDEEAYLNRANYSDFLPGVDFAGFVSSPKGNFAKDQAAIANPNFGGSMLAYTVGANNTSVTSYTLPDFSNENGNLFWTIKGTKYLVRPDHNVIKLVETAPSTSALTDQAMKDRYTSLTSTTIDVPDHKYESMGFIGACTTAWRKYYKVTLYYADGTTDVQVEEISGGHNPNTSGATYKDGQIYLANFLDTSNQREARFGFIPWDIDIDSSKVITKVKFEIDEADTNTTRAGHIISVWGVPVGGVDEPEAPQPSVLDTLVTELEELNDAGITSDATLLAVEAKVAEIDTYLAANTSEALTAEQKTVYDTAKANIQAYKDAQIPDDGGDEPTDDTAIYADGKIWFDLNGNARLFVKSTDDVYVNRATYKDYLPGVDFAGTVQNPTGDFATDQAAVKFPNNGGAMFAYTVDEKPSSLAAGTLPDLTKNGDNYYWTMKGTPYLLRVNEKVIKIAGIGGTFGAGVTEENKAKYQTLRDGTTMDVPDKKYDSLGFLVGTVGAYRKSYEVSVYYQGEETPTSTIITINGTENATNANYTLGTVPLQSFTNTTTTTEYRYNFVAKEIPVDSSKVVTAVKFCEDYSNNFNYARSGLIISAWGVEATGTGSAEEATLKALVNELEDINNKGITSEATLSAVEAKIAEIDTLISGNANLTLTADQQKIYNRVKSNIKVYKDSVAPAEHITANGKIWFDLKGNSRLFVKSTDEAYTNRKTYQDYLPGVDFAGFLASPTGVFAADQMSMTHLVSITDGSGGGMLVYTENENPASPTLSTPADLKTDAEGNHFFTVNGGTYLVRPDKNVIKVVGTTVSTSALEDANIAARYKSLKAGTTIDIPDKKYTSVGFLTAVRHSYTKYVTVDLYYKGEETPVTVEIKCSPKRGTSAYVKDINFKLFANTYEDMSSSGHYFTESTFETDPSKVLTAIHVKDNGPSSNASWPAHIVSAWGVEKVVTIDELITELKNLNSASATDFTALKEKVAEIDEFLAKNSQTASDLTAEQRTAYDEAVNKIANAELSGSIEIAYKDEVPYAKVTINNISELAGKTYKVIIVYIDENNIQLGRKIVDGTSTTALSHSYDVELTEVPAGTKTIKGLIWKDFATLLTLAR